MSSHSRSAEPRVRNPCTGGDSSPGSCRHDPCANVQSSHSPLTPAAVMRPGLRPHSPAIPPANASRNNVPSIGPWITVHTSFHAYNQTMHSGTILSAAIALEPRDNTGMGTWSMLRPPLVVGALFAGQLARAILRDDLPTLENQDPSGIFGSRDDPPLTIVFLGDSSVTAPGVEPLDHSWPRQIAFHLATSYRVTALSTAVGGAKVKDVLDLQLDVALEAKPDLAYVSVGSNDALRGSSTARFEADYNRVVGRLHSRVPAVGLSGIGDLGTIPRLPELARGVARIRARSIDAAIARVSQRYPRTVKSNAWDVMEMLFTDESDMYGEDLFHASAEGHLSFSHVGKPVADRMVDIWKQEVDGSQPSREQRTDQIDGSEA
jgi:lysophospholipase L1-like esterase